jgi:polar amino acid transport system substrate-binding protein
VRNDFPPIGSIDTDGKPVGFGPDLALAFGKKLGVKVEFVPTTSRTRIPLLQNGSIDCEFGITTPTVERELTVDFTIPYVWDAVSLITKEGGSRKVADYAPPKKVATTQGSYIIELMKQAIANPDIVLFQEYPDAVQALKNGKVDGVGVNNASAVAYARKGSGLQLSEDMVRDPWGIMLRPNDSQLAQLAEPYAAGALEGWHVQGSVAEAHGCGARLLHVLPLYAAAGYQVIKPG